MQFSPPSGLFAATRVLCAALIALISTDASATPFKRTEERRRCEHFERHRQPFFGDTHVHTSFSFDSMVLGGSRNDPRDAYEFAQGQPKLINSGIGPLRPVRLRRPLDFAIVTDHAEYLGETRICTSPHTPGYDERHCRVMRFEEPGPLGLSAQTFWGLNIALPHIGEISTCTAEGADCDTAAASVWQEIQRAAEASYDRSSACTFTSFVGYEYTGSTLVDALHRNVIFRNRHVPEFPTSAFETGGANPEALWAALQSTCLDSVPGCEVMTIVHNSNQSGGDAFPDPASSADAATQAFFEPLVEMTQAKGSSECRFDRLVGAGVGTEDELCAWEQRRQATRVGPIVPIDLYPPRNMVRNVLKDGLTLEASLGVNPFKFGMIGSTDNHKGTPGNVVERDDTGNDVGFGATPESKIAGLRVYDNPGGLAVVWAEENRRDALFEAMQRREVYATSGTRPIVRFFGGWRLNENLCNHSNRVRQAYKRGVPMGGDLRPRRKREPANPRFLVSAFKDAGSAGLPGTDLQRIQIVKAWVDESGQTHEQVIDVAGDPDNGAGVDPDTCEPVGTGFSELCEVWEDTGFDPARPALYYARVLENPTCRWSTFACKELGVDPFSPTCEADAAEVSEDLANCCLDATNDPFVQPTTQERAWTSPIWYRPDG